MSDAYELCSEPRVRIEVVTGEAIGRVLDAVAELRLCVFAEWPYLYEGTAAQERDYLSALSRSRGSVCVVAMDEGEAGGGRGVGASTAMPMGDEHEAFAKPFVEAGIDPTSVFYLAESVLRPAYRRLGIGRAFFAEREAHGRRLDERRRAEGVAGFDWLAFCAVDRPSDHPLRPGDYRELGPWWRSLGYERREGLTAHFAWKDVDRPEETRKPLTYWLKPMHPATRQ